MLKREEVVGFISRCSIDILPVLHAAGVKDGTRMFGTEAEYGEPQDLLENEIPLVFRVERRVGNKKVASLRPSGSVVVYIDQKNVTFYLPDNDVSISVIKELMREESPFPYYSRDRKVQLFQNDAKLTDDTMLSECMSTEIKYSGSSILTYHLTAEYSEEYSVYYLDKPSKVICDVQVLSTDTIAHLKAAIEESSGIPLQNQALYDIYESRHYFFGTWYDVNCKSGHKLKLHDHQVVGDFVCYGRVYLGQEVACYHKYSSWCYYSV